MGESGVVQVKALRRSLERVSARIEDIAEKLEGYEAPTDGKYYVRGNGQWNEIDTNTPTINEYELRNAAGEVIGRETINSIVEKVRAGTILDEYPIGSRIVIPYKDIYDGVTYECPFIFGTVQTFKKIDYSKRKYVEFTGLGLVAEYGLPGGSIQFDGMESSDAGSLNGLNNWRYSALRQWLNKHGKQWFSPQHNYDLPPNVPNPENTTGFLDTLPQDFVDACVCTRVCTMRPSHTYENYYYRINYHSSSYDAMIPLNFNYMSTTYCFDDTFDKFFPLSLYQVNCTLTRKAYCTDEIEGRYWEYWRNKTGSSDYVSGEDSISLNNCQIYSIKDHYSECSVWLRSANTTASGSNSLVELSYFRNGVSTTRASNSMCVAPACVIG